MDRVGALVQAWQEATPDSPDEPVRVATEFGMVCLANLEPGGDGSVTWVDVTVEDPESGDPMFRVINPPTLVPDPEGDVERNGVRYRTDPVAALAAVIGSAGGVRAGRGW